MTRVLVTGCAGYIGSVLCRELVKKGYFVMGIDRLAFNNRQGVLPLLSEKNFVFAKADVRDLDTLRYYVDQSDVVIPLAAIVGAPACDSNKKSAEEINYLAIKTLCDVMYNRQRLIFPNTNSGYGKKTDGVCDESSPLNPISVYGKTKQYAENYVLDRHNSVSLRLATVCGVSPRMRFDLLVNDFAAKYIFTRDLTLYEAFFKRNYVHVMDVARAFMYMIEQSNYNGAFNLGDPTANLSKMDLAVRICKFYGCDDPSHVIKLGQGKDPDQRDYVISNDKILQHGFTFKYNIENALAEIKKFCYLHTHEEVLAMNNLSGVYE